MKRTTLEELKEEAFKDPEVKEAYEELTGTLSRGFYQLNKEGTEEKLTLIVVLGDGVSCVRRALFADGYLLGNPADIYVVDSHDYHRVGGVRADNVFFHGDKITERCVKFVMSRYFPTHY